jgi:alkylation response protein AidB-like acyl-CoA dehydrogenase
MDFQLPAEDDPRRVVVQEWIRSHPNPSGRVLAEAGYVAPHWPAPFGLEADPIHQIIIDDELSKAGIRRPANPIGIGWAGPTIMFAGTEEQKQKYILRLLSGEDFWCQLFSEPNSGSDLANLGTRAVRDGDEYIVNGQKIWTSGAQHAEYGILIARTNPDAPKHKGVSYFICPMDLPGIEIRPIKEMTGASTFNEVFFTDVRIPVANLVGEQDEGWRLAKVTLGNERVSLSTGGVLWGSGPTALEMLDAVRDRGPVSDPIMRQRLATIYTEHVLLDLIRMRTLSARLRGEQPGPEASIRKVLADEHGQNVMEVARDLLGANGMLRGGDDSSERGAHNGLGGGGGVGLRALEHPGWFDGYMFARSLTIGGGTGEVQRNIVAERVLGLPHDNDVLKGMSWAETQKSASH